MSQPTCALIADMHQGMLEGIRGLLETVFANVVMVADETSLFETAKKLQPDITFIDISMTPDEKVDVNIAQRFKKSFPDQKFIVLSVYDDKVVIDRIVKDGANGYVLKRKAVNDLLRATEVVLSGKTFVSSTNN